VVVNAGVQKVKNAIAFQPRIRFHQLLLLLLFSGLLLLLLLLLLHSCLIFLLLYSAPVEDVVLKNLKKGEDPKNPENQRNLGRVNVVEIG
jgi:hypothetical protein